MHTNRPPQIELPDKLYFKIGEVSTLTGLPTYVLRFWESEFKQINPKRTPSGQRLYTRKDVEVILEIRSILYEKRYTIPGAKKYLNTRRGLKPKKGPGDLIEEIRLELRSIREMLS